MRSYAKFKIGSQFTDLIELQLQVNRLEQEEKNDTQALIKAKSKLETKKSELKKYIKEHQKSHPGLLNDFIKEIINQKDKIKQKLFSAIAILEEVLHAFHDAGYFTLKTESDSEQSRIKESYSLFTTMLAELELVDAAHSSQRKTLLGAIADDKVQLSNDLLNVISNSVVELLSNTPQAQLSAEERVLMWQSCIRDYCQAFNFNGYGFVGYVYLFSCLERKTPPTIKGQVKDRVLVDLFVETQAFLNIDLKTYLMESENLSAERIHDIASLLFQAWNEGRLSHKKLIQIQHYLHKNITGERESKEESSLHQNFARISFAALIQFIGKSNAEVKPIRNIQELESLEWLLQECDLFSRDQTETTPFQELLRAWTECDDGIENKFLIGLLRKVNYLPIVTTPDFHGVPEILVDLEDDHDRLRELGLAFFTFAPTTKFDALYRACAEYTVCSSEKTHERLLAATEVLRWSVDFNEWTDSPYYHLFVRKIDPALYEQAGYEKMLPYLDEPAFRTLYQNWSEATPEQKPHCFIHLFLQHIAGNEYAEDILFGLAEIEQLPFVRDKNETIFNLVQNFILRAKRDEAVEDTLSLVDIVSLVHMTLKAIPEEDDRYSARLEALHAKPVLVAEDFLDLQEQIRRDYPLSFLSVDEDTLERIFNEEDAEALIDFIKSIELQHFVMTRRGLEFLQKILVHVDKNYHNHSSFKRVLPLFASFDFNARIFPGDKTWLQFALDRAEPLIHVAIALIERGADDLTAPQGEKTPMAMVLDTINAHPELLSYLNGDCVRQFLSYVAPPHEEKEQDDKVKKRNELFSQWLNRTYTEFDSRIKSPERLFSAVVSSFSYVEAEKFACNLIRMGRFDLLKIFDDAYRAKYHNLQCWMESYLTDREFRKTYLNAFAQRGIDVSDLAVLTAPGVECAAFFSSYHQMVPLYHKHKTGLLHQEKENILRYVFCTYNTVPYSPKIGEAFFEAYAELLRAANEPNRGTRVACLAAITAFKSGIFCQLSIEQISIIMHSVASLVVSPKMAERINKEIKELFRGGGIRVSFEFYRRVLDRIHAEVYSDDAPELRNLEEVQKEFTQQKLSFDKVLSLSQLSYTAEQKQPTSYFFSVYKNVRHNITQQAYTQPYPTLQAMVSVYQTSQPGKWNIDEDTRFFTALCGIARDKLHKVPHPAQFATVMGVMYCVPSYATRLLVEVEEGKTMMIALSIACVTKMLVGHGVQMDSSFVPVCSQTDPSAAENHRESEPFFTALGISSQVGMDGPATVCYTTGPQLVRHMAREDYQSALGEEEAKQEPLMVFVDETDVGLSMSQDTVLSLVHPMIACFPEGSDFLKAVYQYSDEDQDFYNLPEFMRLPSDLQDHFKKHSFAWKMGLVTERLRIHGYMVNDSEQKLGDVKKLNIPGEKTDDYSISHSQFHELATQGKITTPYQVPFHRLSYRETFKQFPFVVGFSGHLERKAELTHQNFQVVESLRDTRGQLTKEPPMVCKDDAVWLYEIKRIIGENVILNAQRLPVIIIVEDMNAAKSLDVKLLLSRPPYFLQTIDDGENLERQKAQISKATQANVVTIISKQNARGRDFRCHDERINSAGGVQVILGFYSASLNEIKQAEHCTGSQGVQGRCHYIYKYEKVCAVFKDFNLAAPEVYDPNFAEHNKKLQAAFVEKHMTTKGAEPSEFRLFYHRLRDDKGKSKEQKLQEIHRYLLQR